MDAPWAEGVRDHSTSADTIRCLSRASGKPRSVTGKRRESSTVMPHQDEPERARALLDLHQPGNPVILPTVWDAWSAKLAVGAGFAALTVGSHPLADSIGKPDNEGMSFDDVLARVAQITAAGGVRGASAKPPQPVPTFSIRSDGTTRKRCGAWQLSCLYQSTRSPCRTGTTPPHSARSVLPASASDLFCSMRCPPGPTSCSPAGVEGV